MIELKRSERWFHLIETDFLNKLLDNHEESYQMIIDQVLETKLGGIILYKLEGIEEERYSIAFVMGRYSKVIHRSSNWEWIYRKYRKIISSV
jgi:hypothetical protein